MRSQHFEFAVIGAGIAGVSVAAALANHGRVILIERESQPAYHATGRSAAILAQTYGPDIVRALTKASERFLDTPPDGFADHPLLSPRGLIQIAREDQVDALRNGAAALEDTGQLEWITAYEVQRRVPILRQGYAAGGYLNAAAQDLDVHAMMQGYLRQFRARGGQIGLGTGATGLRQVGQSWQIGTRDTTIRAGIVINAAGAWADQVAQMAGLAPIGLRPLRRSAVTFRPPDHITPATLPMVVDAEEAFYLKPEAGMLLASPANETPSDPTDSQPEEIEVAVAIDRVLTAFDLDVRRIEAKWAGLRTFSPDRAPVCGFDDRTEGFFWLAAQGGYGIQTAPALSELSAHLITGAALDAEYTAHGPEPARLSPNRFMSRG